MKKGSGWGRDIHKIAGGGPCNSGRCRFGDKSGTKHDGKNTGVGGFILLHFAVKIIAYNVCFL